MSFFSQPVAITGVAVRSCLGSTPEEHAAAMRQGRHGLRPLGEYPGLPAQFAAVPGGWLNDRSCLKGRRCGAASNFAVHLAREAVASASLEPADLARAWIFAGSSRGNAGELFDLAHNRRPVRKFAASNSMHSEIPAAVSIALGIRGGWHLLSNGCSSGLDAIGMGAAMIAAGLAPRVIAVAVDLPLVPRLLADFAATGLLSRSGRNDPWSPDADGFFPAEAGAALVLEPAAQAGVRARALIHGYWVNSDAHDLIGMPADGAPVAELLRAGRDGRVHGPVAICPHASGTRVHGCTEPHALQSALAPESGSMASGSAPSATAHLMKPFTGHSLGASGAVDTAILATFLQDGLLPPNLPGLTAPPGLPLPAETLSARGRDVLKLSTGMGGHNALLLLTGED